MKTTFLSLFLVLSLTAISNAQDEKSNYKIANKIALDSNGGWDYIAVDEETNRLYVSHGNIVQVVDLNTNKQIGLIPYTNGVHGIAIANDLKKGYISDGKDTAVTIFNLKTNAIIAKIKVSGQKPDAIVYDEVTKRVFTMNGKTSDATVIDAKTDKVIATIPLDGKPEFCVADGTGKIYVNIEDKAEIQEIDAKDIKVLKKWSIAPGESPSGLAMDKKNRRLFSVCDNEIMVISDPDNGKVITTVPIKLSPDAAAFDPSKMLVYSSDMGSITVVKEETPDTYKVVETFYTQRGARTLAVNTKTQHIYEPVADFMPVHPIRSNTEKPKPAVKPGTFVVLDIVPIQ